MHSQSRWLPFACKDICEQKVYPGRVFWVQKPLRKQLMQFQLPEAHKKAELLTVSTSGSHKTFTHISYSEKRK
jgi:hypothetical protein